MINIFNEVKIIALYDPNNLVGMMKRPTLPSYCQGTAVAYKSPTNSMVKKKSTRKPSKNKTSYYSNVVTTNEKYENSKCIDKSLR